MSELAQILAFYSFKGGVGRSMAVLNLAYSLAAKGRHVLVLDMDLEAPGLSGFLDREKQIEGFARCDMVDLVKWASSVILPTELGDYPPLTDYAVEVPPKKVVSGNGNPSESGRLHIIPVQEERDYYNRLAELDLGKYDQEDLVRTGSVLRDWLKSLHFEIEVPDYYGPNCERTASYDYVLVDSRTGITETGGLCIGPLSDQLVVLTALNDQNVEGTRRFLEEVGVLANPGASPESSGAPGLETGSKPCLIVASLVPTGEIKTKQERLKRLEDALGKPVVKLSYHPQLALKESIFTRDYRDEYLAREYEALLLQIQGMTSDGLDKVLPGVLLGQSRTPKQLRRTPEQLREGLAQILRSAWVTSLVPLLHYLLSSFDFAEISQDTDFVLWDRVCRVLAKSEDPLRWDAIQRWANLLSQWSLQSTDPSLASARFENAMSRYAELLQDKNASPVQKAMAVFNRGITYSKHGQQEKAIGDYTAVVRMPDAPADRKAMALVNRGVTYGQQNESEKAIGDYTAVVQMPDAPAEQKARALVARGITYGQQNESEKAIGDYTAVVQMPDAPAEQKATALVNRGITYGQQNESEKAVGDYTAVVQMPDAPAEQKATALVARGITYGQRNESEKAIGDYTAVVQMPEAPAEQKARALVARGITFGQQNESEKAIGDYTAVVEMPDAPAEQKASALSFRGVTYNKQGESEKEIADYTAIVEMPNAPTEQKANALVKRGVIYGQQSESEKAIADYTAVIEMPDAPAEQKAKALVNRGWKQFVAGRHIEAIQDYRQVTILIPNECLAHGTLAIALLVSGQTDQALESYARALTLATEEELDAIRKDLHKAIEKHGPLPGAEEVMKRLEAGREHLGR
jgi:tetratricopeptide (TPR) repeat protein